MFVLYLSFYTCRLRTTRQCQC